MNRYGLSASKAGLPPGTLVHIGDMRAERAIVSALRYSAEESWEREEVPLSEVASLTGQEGILWLHVAGLSHIGTVKRIGEVFGIHPLVLEDILNTNQRPKFEDYGNYVYMTLKILNYRGDKGGVASEHINVVLGRDFVLSFQESQASYFKGIRERLKSSPDRFYKHGAGYLAYTLLDMIVDGYFVVLEELGEQVEALEDRLIEQQEEQLLPAIHSLKKEMLFLRRSVWPLREVIAAIERDGSPLFQESTLLYLRDVYDHTIQVIETLEIYRDMTSGMIDIYLSGVSNRMNAVVKMLTVISTIFMPLTFLAGVYGMNFKYMPELEWEYGYPVALLIMIVIGVFMYRYFRKKAWI